MALRSLLDFDLNVTLTLPYKHAFALPIETVGTRPVRGLLRVGFVYTLPLSVIYIAGLFVIQRWMRDKPPYCLRRPLIAWNAFLALFSLLGFLRTAEEIVYVLREHGFYYSICYAYEPHSITEFWAVLFAGSKLFELGDSLFIVLRKKPLIFLHYYHHAAVLIYTIHSGAEHTASGRWFISINYAIHALMYGYYLVTACGRRLPRWTSVGITSAQIVQMLIGLWLCWEVGAAKLRGDECKQSNGNLLLGTAMYASFAALFINFFTHSYLGRDKDRSRKEKSL